MIFSAYGTRDFQISIVCCFVVARRDLLSPFQKAFIFCEIVSSSFAVSSRVCVTCTVNKRVDTLLWGRRKDPPIGSYKAGHNF